MMQLIGYSFAVRPRESGDPVLDSRLRGNERSLWLDFSKASSADLSKT
jgi:hypothetical protein